MTINNPTETNPNLDEALGPDGFLDFYKMLGLPGDAPNSLITTRINDLYSNAQENREHRHLAKRREAELMLDLLPHALNVLNIAENRARYDSYAAGARAGASIMDFETFMNSVIKGTSDIEERKGMIGIRPDPLSTMVTAAPAVSFGTNGTRVIEGQIDRSQAALASGEAAKVAATPTTVSVSRPASRDDSWSVISQSPKFAPAAIIGFLITFVASDALLHLAPIFTLILSSAAALALSCFITSRGDRLEDIPSIKKMRLW